MGKKRFFLLFFSSKKESTILFEGIIEVRRDATDISTTKTTCIMYTAHYTLQLFHHWPKLILLKKGNQSFLCVKKLDWNIEKKQLSIVK